MLFENMLRILDGRDLAEAKEQGKSYALMLGVSSFVAASPEGLRVDSLRRDEPEMHISLDERDARVEGVRSKLLELRTI